MPAYSCDVLIKTLRLEKGLTQSRLAEGICAKDTLSRIERGERLPDWYTFSQLMERLGEDPDKYYKTIITKNDKYFLDVQEEINGYLRYQDYELLEKRVLEIEQEELFKSGVYLQYLLATKAAYYNHVGKDAQETLDLVTEALRLTRKNFDEDKIDTYILSEREILCINVMAIAYDRLSGLEKTLSIFQKLKMSLDKNYMGDKWKNDFYRILLSNTARVLRYTGRHSECVELCDEGIAQSRQYSDMSLYPKFMANKGFSLLHLGREQEGNELLVQLCCFYTGIGMPETIEDMRTRYEGEFGKPLIFEIPVYKRVE